jgi:predicted nucleotidyltransferase/DNA-binding transcriptional ArsR family regulator
MRPNPIDLLFTAYRRQVLGLLLPRPDDSLHVREISRLTGVPAGSLHRELRTLTEAGLLLREPLGNQVRYRANRAAPLYPELAGIFRKAAAAPEKTRKPPLRSAKAEAVRHTLHSPVAEYAAAPKVAAPKVGAPIPSPATIKRLCRKFGIARLALFGSAARGEMTPESDVDLLVEFAPDSKVSLFDIPAIQDAFSAAFGGRQVDIATPEVLENPYRRKTILRDARVLYAP